MSYNLTDNQQPLARWIVQQIRAGELSEEFYVMWLRSEGEITGFSGEHPAITKGLLDALSAAELIICTPNYRTTTSTSGKARPRATSRETEIGRRCVVTATAYKAVESNFSAPDTSFVTQLTPLADVTNLDTELKTRCLPILGAGSADPKLWDSAVRTAGVILEDRLRDVGGIADASRIGQKLVNDVFGKSGSLAVKFSIESERQGHRDLYAGVVGTLRNPSAHRLLDPSPEDGGAQIVFINLLLKILEDLR